MSEHAIQFAEEVATEKLKSFWKEAGLGEPQYPVQTLVVAEMLDGAGYRVDADDLIGWATTRIIDTLRDDGRIVWTPTSIMAAMIQCEGRRRWKLHPNHIHKMSAMEREELQAVEEGRGTSFNDLDQFDIESLLIYLVACERQVDRHAMHLAILAKLRAGDVL